jgi:thioesterase domain-containing protein
MPRELLARLRERDIHVSVDGEKLRCNAPEGALTPELRDLISAHKPQLIAFLTAGQAWSSHVAIVPLQTEGSRLPFFAVPGHNGDVFCYVHLAKALGRDQPFYALQPPGLEGSAPPVTSIPELASLYADELSSFRPHGPFLLGGYCLGGTIAFETARQLTARGREVAQLVLFGAACPTALKPSRWGPIGDFTIERARQLRSLGKRPLAQWIPHVWSRVRGARRRLEDAPLPDERSRRRDALMAATVSAIRSYDLPEPFSVQVTLVLPNEEFQRSEDRPLDWRQLVEGELELFVGPQGNEHDMMLREPYVGWAADRLAGLIDRTVPQQELAASQ